MISLGTDTRRAFSVGQAIPLIRLRQRIASVTILGLLKAVSVCWTATPPALPSALSCVLFPRKMGCDLALPVPSLRNVFLTIREYYRSKAVA